MVSLEQMTEISKLSKKDLDIYCVTSYKLWIITLAASMYECEVIWTDSAVFKTPRTSKVSSIT